MLTFSPVFNLLVFAWLLYRQRKIRPARQRLRLPVVLGVIGLIELSDFTHQHHLGGSVLAVLGATFVVAAVGMAALRAFTIRLWRQGPWVLRQGTWLTIGLWLLSVALHLGSEIEVHHLHGPDGATSSSLLLFLAVSLGVQRAVLHKRVLQLLDGDTGGPTAMATDAPTWGGGSRVGSQFGTGRMGRWGASWGGSANPGRSWRDESPHDPDVIDVASIPVVPPNGRHSSDPDSDSDSDSDPDSDPSAGRE